MNRGFRETGNPAKIRQLNRQAVLNYLRGGRPTSRAELAKTLDLAPATVSAVVGDLIGEGLLIETGLLHVDKRSPGRPSKEIKLNPSAAYVVGIVMRIEQDVLYLDTSWSDYSGSVSVGSTVVVADKDDVTSIANAVFDTLDSLCEEPLTRDNVVSLCLGIPGVANDSQVLFCPNIKALQGEEFHQLIADRAWLPVHYENDVNLVVVSELDDQPRLRSVNFSYLFISQGAGSGTALNGELWKSSGWAGEIGQLEVPFADFGMRKLEWIIGMGGYVANFEQQFGLALGDALAAFEQGATENPQAMSVVGNYIDYLYMAIQTLNAAFDLDEVVIGESSHGVVGACLPLLQKKIDQSHLAVTLSQGKDARKSSVQGAALLALQHALGGLEQ